MIWQSVIVSYQKYYRVNCDTINNLKITISLAWYRVNCNKLHWFKNQHSATKHSI